MRLKSKSAVSCTRARPGPTTEVTIDLDLLAQAPLVGDLALVGAAAERRRRRRRRRPAGGRSRRRSTRARGLRPLTAEATRWRMARTCCGSSAPRTLSTIEADGSALSRENSGRSGSTRCTRAACTRSMRADGAGQFAFERAQVVDVLDEAGGAERVGLVENLVADAAALGQAAFGELHAQPRHLVLRHQDDRAVVLELVGDALALQVLDDRGGVLDDEVGEQRRHLRRGDAQDEEGEEADQRDRDRAHRRKPRRAERLDERRRTPAPDQPRDSKGEPNSARFARSMVSIRLMGRFGPVSWLTCWLRGLGRIAGKGCRSKGASRFARRVRGRRAIGRGKCLSAQAGLSPRAAREFLLQAEHQLVGDCGPWR